MNNLNRKTVCSQYRQVIFLRTYQWIAVFNVTQTFLLCRKNAKSPNGVVLDNVG